MKVLEIIRKTSLAAFLLKNLSCPIYPPITIAKTDSTASVSFVCSYNFRNYCESVCGSMTKLLCFATLSRTLTRAWYVPKSNYFRNFKTSPFNRICRLTVQNLQGIQKHLTKFIKSVLRLRENFLELVSNMAPYQKYTYIQAAAFSLVCF